MHLDHQSSAPFRAQGILFQVHGKPHEAGIPCGERLGCVGLSRLQQESIHPIYAALHGANGSEGVGQGANARLHSLKQPAFEGAAMIRSRIVDATNGSIEAGAGLKESRLGAGPTPDLDATRVQSCDAFGRQQPDVGEQDPIATQGALSAETGVGGGLEVSLIHDTRPCWMQSGH